ncbi:hypothetical protein NQ318_019908 [Aromia moschata]|uniref:Uncharacterized protein n=1 Tax=Aromia moschata TaxID=1265417 RepID=A0AAV8XIN5_9CUCU|nr:hypothetical protein NQ318_019908 [Aromia moschata]
MAKLQIFVFALLLVQGYCVSVSLLPEQIQTRPLPIPEAPVAEQPPCVSYVVLLLQAIIDKLSELPVNRPMPELEIDDEVLLPENPESESEVPEIEEGVPEVNEEVTNPCTACFEYITTLMKTAKKTVASRQ